MHSHGQGAGENLVHPIILVGNPNVSEKELTIDESIAQEILTRA